MSGNTDLNEALEKLDMATWLDGQGLDYKHARGARGPQLNIRECPCCGDDRWKVFMNAETGLGNCFHGDCEAKFSKWKFIRACLPKHSNREVVEEILRAASDQGWTPKVVVAAPVHIDTLKLPRSYPIPIDGRNVKYLEDRGIDTDTAKYFNLRLCLKGGFEYHNEAGERLWQNYSRRIIIPIFDMAGELVSYQGRDITGTAERKYLFPPGFASTGSHLYNIQNVVGKTELIANEGAFDVIATAMALNEDADTRHIGVVGTFGKHLSDGENSQVEKFMALKDKGLRVVTFMWDGERRATEDAIAAALLLRRHGLRTRVALLPRDKDPNEISAAEVREAYWKALPIDGLKAAQLLARLPSIYPRNSLSADCVS